MTKKPKKQQQPPHDKETVTLRGHQALIGTNGRCSLDITEARHFEFLCSAETHPNVHKPRNNSILNEDQIHIIQFASFSVIHIFKILTTLSQYPKQYLPLDRHVKG